MSEKGCNGDCCSCHAHDIENMDDMEEMLDDKLVLIDDDGNEREFEMLDVVLLDETEYLIVAQIDEEKEVANLEILEVKEDEDEEFYDTVIDKELAKKILDLYKKQNDLDAEIEFIEE